MRRPVVLIAACVAVLLVVSGVAAWRLLVVGGTTRAERVIQGAHGAQLHTVTVVPRGATPEHPAPAVLVAQGLGGSRDDVRGVVTALVRAGYVVRTWDSRGTGRSTGHVGIAGPDAEVADVSRLVDELASRRDVARDGIGDPRVAVVGVSHGGGIALLTAARDHRIDAIVPIFAWADLEEALEPGGVLKVRWASQLFATGSGRARSANPCGNVEAELCAAWSQSAQAGAFTPHARELLAIRSVRSELERIDAPTLVVQGQYDSLFGFEQAHMIERGLRAARTTVRVEWLRGGHDLPLGRETRAHLETAVVRWLDHHLAEERDVDTGPGFTVQLGAGRGYASAPSIDSVAQRERIALEPVQRPDARGRLRVASPPGGLPAEATTLPGLGDVTTLGDRPPSGQRVRFESAPVDGGVEIVGAPRVRLAIAGTQPEAVLFVHLVDVAKDGRRLLPRGLVTPVRVTDIPPLSGPRTVDVSVTLPWIAWRLAPGHRLAVEVATTDLGYVGNMRAATYAVALAGADEVAVPVARKPMRSDETFDSGISRRTLLIAAAALVFGALAGGVLIARGVRRRDARVQEPHLRDVPLSAERLVKHYGRDVTAVAGMTFEVSPGAVVGLVGPNGAGKTTVLRMLLGLVHPSDGTAHAFGQRVRPGVPMLRRFGVLVEGPGLLPHVSGRRHLHRYAEATGRPADSSSIDAALAQVDLLEDADRRVRTYSHGMRQRLAIAQALLGAPECVVLDEPSNGLDPAQIRHLRDIIRGVAGDGRTVLVSSHLLGELEQVCTHVVCVAGGRVIASGTLDDVRGEHDTLEAAFLAAVEEAHDAG